jgi:hypothetical protein
MTTFRYERNCLMPANHLRSGCRGQSGRVHGSGYASKNDAVDQLQGDLGENPSRPHEL